MANQNFRIRLILLVNGGGLSMTNNWKEKQRKGEDIVKTSLNSWVYQMFQFDSFVFLSFTIETRNHFGGSWAQLLYFIKLQKGQVTVEILWLKKVQLKQHWKFDNEHKRRNDLRHTSPFNRDYCPSPESCCPHWWNFSRRSHTPFRKNAK